MDPSSPNKKAQPADKKILVVDDDDAVLAMVKATLEMEGFQVRTQRDSRDIVKKAAAYAPDLIISDLMMPGGGGYDLLRTLQGDPATQKIPVIIMTGSHMNDSTKAMMKQESNLIAYFEKPMRPESLLRNIHQMLNTISRADDQRQRSKEAPTDFKDLW